MLIYASHKSDCHETRNTVKVMRIFSDILIQNFERTEALRVKLSIAKLEQLVQEKSRHFDDAFISQ